MATINLLIVMPCRKHAQFQIYKILHVQQVFIHVQLKSIYTCLHLFFHGSHFRLESGMWSGGYNVWLKWVPIPDGVREEWKLSVVTTGIWYLLHLYIICFWLIQDVFSVKIWYKCRIVHIKNHTQVFAAQTRRNF